MQEHALARGKKRDSRQTGFGAVVVRTHNMMGHNVVGDDP